jgi:hypothetical protein
MDFDQRKLVFGAFLVLLVIAFAAVKIWIRGGGVDRLLKKKS